MTKRLIVIGAGPVGLAAALGAVQRGFDVTVLERDDVGASLTRWGQTRLFSPLAMNVAEGVGELLALPDGDVILTGSEFVDAVLRPLANSAPLAGRVHARHRVIAVERSGMSRGAYAGHPIRGERSFRIVVDTPAGERELEADAVLDASGVPLPSALVARGERTARMIRSLGELHDRRGELAGRRIALVGHGHSAANALLVLATVAMEAPATRVVWAVRTPNARPCVEVASDPLPERQRVVAAANELAAHPPWWLRIERRARVLAIEMGRVDRTALPFGSAAGPGQARAVELSGSRTIEVDEVIAFVGARPDLSFTSELALELSAATEGAGRLSRALAHVTDCLSVPKLGAADLASGEPGFHFIGAKSYGRAKTFLLQTGYAQVATILDGLQQPS